MIEYAGALKYPVVFGIAFVSALLLTPIARRLAFWFGAVDQPDERRIHKAVTPRAGGLAVFAAVHLTLAAVLAWRDSFGWQVDFSAQLSWAWWWHFFAVSSALLVVGFFDDIRGLSWRFKLLCHVAAGVAMFLGDVRVGQVLGTALPGWLDAVLTVAWCVGFINAFNLIDGLDGLAAGLASIAGIGLVGASVLAGAPGDSLMILALVGACAGFLRFNFHPATIFLGDSGSMFIGLTLATMSLSTENKSSAFVTLGASLMAVGVPLFDTLLAVWRRSIRAYLSRRRGENNWARVMNADMDHLHHRLVRLGFDQRKVALVLYSANLALILVGLLSIANSSVAVGVYLLAFIAGTYVVVRHIARVELWDSGAAVVEGLRRPSTGVLATIVYQAIDVLALIGALGISLFLAGFHGPWSELRAQFFTAAPLWCGITFITLVVAGTYSKVWSRARPAEFLLLGVSLQAGILVALGVAIIQRGGLQAADVEFTIVYSAISVMLVVGSRAWRRGVQDLMGLYERSSASTEQRSVLLYGADTEALLYLKRRALRTSRGERGLGKIVGFIDDDRNLRKRQVYGLRVFGDLGDLPIVVEERAIAEIVITATLPPERLIRLQDFCKRRGIVLLQATVAESVLVPGRTAERSVERVVNVAS